jgi:hypothetical protein
MYMKNVLLALILIFSVQFLNAQWFQTGPAGGRVFDLKIEGDKVYAATLGGVLVSTNGTDWNFTNWGINDGDIRAVAISNSKVFAGTYNEGIYSRDVNGFIWQNTSLANITITCMLSQPGGILAGTYSSGVFMSTNNGVDWSEMNTGLTDFQIMCLAQSGLDIFVGTGSKVFRRNPGLGGWVEASNGLPENTITALGVSGSVLYAGVWGHGCYKSTDLGQNWFKFGENSPYYISSIAFRGSKVFIASGNIYWSEQVSALWTEIPIGLNPYANIEKICFFGNKLIAGDNHIWEPMGLYTSDNEGVSWTHTAWALPNYSVSGIAAKEANIYTAACGGFYRSTDGGTTWELPFYHGFLWADFSAVSINDNHIYAGDVNGYSYFSENQGLDLTRKVKIADNSIVTSFTFIGNMIFASTKPFAAGKTGGVFRSTNNGDSWTSVSNGLPVLADTNTDVTSLAVIGPVLFAGTGKGVYRSTDNGANWIKVNNGVPGTNYNVYSLAVKGNELFAGYYSGVYRTSDNGNNWYSTGLNKYVTSMAVSDTNLFAGTWAQGLYLLQDYSSTWKEIGLPNRYVSSIAFSLGNIFAATTYNGLWKTSLSILTNIDDDTNEIPSEFSLIQNYPNPFNPSTTIQWKMPWSGRVTLKIYDLPGNEIETLVDEFRSAGIYQIKFQAGKYASGVYFYRIQSGSRSETRKMILTK